MKKYLLLSILSVSFFFFSCGSDDDNDGVAAGPDNDGCFASWKVDGVDYSEDELSLCIYMDNLLNLSSSFSGGTFQLQIDPVTTPGTYIADPQNQDLFVFVSVKLDDGTTLGSSNVEVVVEEISDSKAKGTFSGAFFDIMDLNQSADFVVTDGKFEADF